MNQASLDPNWIVGIATSLAFLVAAGTYWQAVKVRREEQARLVYSSLKAFHARQAGETFPINGDGADIGLSNGNVRIVNSDNDKTAQQIALEPVLQVTVAIHNLSKEMVSPVRVHLIDSGHGKVWKEFSLSVVVEPKSTKLVEFVFPNHIHPAQPGIGTIITFRDSSSNWWRRFGSEPIDRLHSDPENSGPLREERELTRAYQRSIGIAEDLLVQEPKIGLITHTRRLIRRLRRKPFLP